ncbi:hypothetical protein DFH07DRAFT_868423 [Mycena maculata]|uniref:Uncharacterized protein n=1 Tax=Mycena maculata TaxID=230809 RepID=A0AAD7J358_9AGAR|nr:hypothetical protein DFH07DRAFT_868423 [Mycena maculata]
MIESTLLSSVLAFTDSNSSPKYLSDSDPRVSHPGTHSGFYGLPTNPRCIYKTGKAWPVPPGPEAYRVHREARPIFNHDIQLVWLQLGEAVYGLLDFQKAGPLHLWIGVEPGSLSSEDAQTAAEGCKGILAEAGFPDVEIAFREPIYSPSTGPKLLKHSVSIVDPTADFRSPLIPALGVQIAPKKTPHFEGTGALYFRESIESDRAFLFTCRHVALPPPVHKNHLYEHKKTGKRKPAQERELGLLGEAAEDATITKTRQKFQDRVTKARKTIDKINALHTEITKHWTLPRQRVLGFVIYAPPISVGTGPKKLTEDWALVEIYRDKIDWTGFMGNVVYLGIQMTPGNFASKMHPHPEGRSSLKYPDDGLLQVKGFVKEEEIRQPTQLDANGEECFLVVKNGKTTGVTFGRGAVLESFVRVYDEHGIEKTSIEVAIYPYSNKDGAFSAPGDSGSIVVDGEGRVVDMLAGGAGAT